MFFKYYTADVIEVNKGKSIEVGSTICGFWFYQSPNFAYNKIIDGVRKIGEKFEIKNFRRVK